MTIGELQEKLERESVEDLQTVKDSLEVLRSNCAVAQLYRELELDAVYYTVHLVISNKERGK